MQTSKNLTSKQQELFKGAKNNQDLYQLLIADKKGKCEEKVQQAENASSITHNGEVKAYSKIDGDGGKVEANQQGDTVQGSLTAEDTKQQEQLKCNVADGRAYHKEVIRLHEQEDLLTELSVQPFDDQGQLMVNKDGDPLEVIMDIVVLQNGEKPRLLECKASPTAPLTKNQKKGHPNIEKNGFKVLSGKGSLKKGTKFGPTVVEVWRPPNGQAWKAPRQAQAKEEVNFSVCHDPTKPSISSAPMSQKLMNNIMRLLGFDTKDDVRPDTNGFLGLEDWETDPSTRPEKLPGMKDDQGSQQMRRLLQIMLYKLAKAQGKSPLEAKAAAEGADALKRGSELFMKAPPTGSKTATDEDRTKGKTVKMATLKIMKQLGFEEEKDFVVKDDVVQPAELEEGLNRFTDASTSMLRTIAFLDARRSGKTQAEARAIAKGPDVASYVYNRLRRHGQGDRGRFKYHKRTPPTELNRKTDKLLAKIQSQMEENGHTHVKRNQCTSDETRKEEVLKAVKSGDKEGLCRIVEKLSDQEVLEAIKDNDALVHEWKQLQEEQRQELTNAMLVLVEAAESHSSDADVVTKVDKMLDSMYHNIGNWELTSDQLQRARRER